VNKKNIQYQGQHIIRVYTFVIILWSIVFTSLVYLENKDLTILAIVLMVTASLFIIKTKIYRMILIGNYIVYCLITYMVLEEQLVINELWFKGLIFFILAYIVSRMNYLNIMSNYQLSQDLKDSNKILEEKATRDSLSGLYHNAYIFNYLEEKIISSGLSNMAVLMMDIDNFKNINDTYGHLFGDEVIKRISAELEDSTSNEDILGRYGGEEFIVIMNHTDVEKTISVAEMIRSKIENLKFVHPVKVTISIGIAFYSGEDAKAFIKKADDQLYRAKSLGKNRVVREED
jgi:diguanylate cyclase (GGDEF)-like protein